MIIPRERSEKSKLLVIFYLLTAFLALIFTVIKVFSALNSVFGDRYHESAVIVQPFVGDFVDSVFAHGVLRSTSVRSLVAMVDGTVAEIVQRPGASVAGNTAIIVMKNPRLLREYDSAKIGLEVANAELVKLQAEIANEMSIRISDKKSSFAELESQKIEYEAWDRLASNNVISRLELEKQKLKLGQAALKYQLALEGTKHLEVINSARISVGLLNVSKAERYLEMKEFDVSSLNIRAEMNGVLQEVDEKIELGYQVRAGDNVGVVSIVDSLFAELRVGALDASRIVENMEVSLNVKGSVAVGKVSRVSPSSERNKIEIDVEIISDLPSTARPNVEVVGEIFFQKKAGVLLLERPEKFSPGEPVTLLVENGSGDSSVRNVIVGSYSDKWVEVLSGLEVGDTIVVEENADN